MRTSQLGMAAALGVLGLVAGCRSADRAERRSEPTETTTGAARPPAGGVVGYAPKGEFPGGSIAGAELGVLGHATGHEGIALAQQIERGERPIATPMPRGIGGGPVEGRGRRPGDRRAPATAPSGRE